MHLGQIMRKSLDRSAYSLERGSIQGDTPCLNDDEEDKDLKVEDEEQRFVTKKIS